VVSAVIVFIGFFAEAVASALVFSGPTKDDCNVDKRVCISDSSTPAGVADAPTDEDEDDNEEDEEEEEAAELEEDDEEELNEEVSGYVKRCMAANLNRSSNTRPSALSEQS
jgi:hypothetical protein